MGAIRAGALALLVVVVGTLTLATAGGYAYQSNVPTETVNVTNETATVDYDTPTTLDEHEFYLTYDESSIAVRNSSNESLTAGTDYEFAASNGTVTWLNTTNTSEGNTAYVDYNATYHPQEARLARTVVESGLLLAVFLPFVVLALGIAGALVNLALAGGAYR